MDRRAVLRITDELLWVLRREGLAIATSQAIDAVRAIALVGFESRVDLPEALAPVVVHPADGRALQVVLEGDLPLRAPLA